MPLPTSGSNDARQGDERFQSAGRTIAERNIPTMATDNGLRCRHAETDTPSGPITRSVNPEEWSKDPGQGVRPEEAGAAATDYLRMFGLVARHPGEVRHR